MGQNRAIAAPPPGRAVPSEAAFTLVELLVVIGIIGVLAAFMLGVGVTLQKKAQRDATQTLIVKVETALEHYRDQFRGFPQELLDAIPTAAELQGKTAQEIADLVVVGNRAVAAILQEMDEFSAAGGAHASEIIKEPDPDNPGEYRYYIVDSWYNADSAEHDLDGSDGKYSYLNIARDGFNRPGLDIWSNGPDGQSHDYDLDHPEKHGDDVVNWGRR